MPLAGDRGQDAAGDPAFEGCVLVVPPTTADGVALGKMFGMLGTPSKILPDMAELVQALTKGGGIAIVSEESVIKDGDVLATWLSTQPVWSDLPVIVLARAGADSVPLALGLSRLGNVTVVERPMRTSTFASLVHSSLRARKKQYEVRAHLEGLQRAEKEIREGELRYRSLIENLSDYAVFMLDLDGHVATWNDGAQAMLQYSATEALGVSAAFLHEIDPDGRRSFDSVLAEVRAAGRSFSLRPFKRGQGPQLMLEELITAVVDGRDQLLGYGVFLRDVTARHQAEHERERLLASERAARAEAERSGRMKDEFLATLSHELRTPLSAILGWAQVAGRAPDLKPAVANALTVIERNARAQAQIIEDLLDMSAIISGKISLNVGEIDVVQCVEAAIGTIRPASQAKGIHVGMTLEDVPRTISGDADRLQQVFWNLLSNAIKFTPKGGNVSIALRGKGSHVEIEIADNGEGIDPAFLPFVFDRFRQSDASTTRRHGGLGLGLSIVRQLIELHGGAVSVASEGKGRGSRFRVSLPVAQVAGATPAAGNVASGSTIERREEEGRVAAEVDLAGITALVVDDEQDARTLLRQIFQDSGARVVMAASADEAIDALAGMHPDVIVSDIGMPLEDGYSLMRRIRARPDSASACPAVALTAYARNDDRLRALDAGFNVHVAKPVDPSALLVEVARLVHRAHEA